MKNPTNVICAIALTPNRRPGASTCSPISQKEKSSRFHAKFVAKLSKIKTHSSDIWKTTLEIKISNVPFAPDHSPGSLCFGRMLLFTQVWQDSSHFGMWLTFLPFYYSTTDRPKQFICKLCSRGFYHRSSLAKHMKRQCSQLKPDFNCGVCVKIFMEKTAQMQSEITFLGRCHCNGNVFSLSSLIVGIVGGIEGSCKFCGKIFPTAHGLSVHLSKHIGDKVFQCDVCANKWTTEENLQKTNILHLKVMI